MKTSPMHAMTILLACTSAFGGEVLRFKSGEIRIEDSSQRLLADSISAQASPVESYFIVQFESKVPVQAEEILAKAGLQVLRYLPEDAYVVRGSLRAAGLSRFSVPGIRAVGTFSPEWKISAELTESRSRYETVIVTGFDETAASAIIPAVKAIPGTHVREIGARDVIVDAETARVADIASLDGVEWVERLPVFVTFDLDVGSAAVQTVGPVPSEYQFTGHESGTRIMNFEAAWSRGFMGQGQIAAVADTGLDVGTVAGIHPDFSGNLIKGHALGLGAKSWEDPMGHGTHVAGSVVGNGAVSAQHIRGGANAAGLVAVGLWSAILDNLAPGSDFNKLIGTPYKDGARVHTNSWGSPANLGAYDTFSAKVDEYTWSNPDMLVLFAAGNSGEDKDQDGRIDERSVSSPGTAKNVLTVGASENELFTGGIQRKHRELRDGDKKWGVEPIASDKLSDNANGLAVFSSRGPTNDGRVKPEIVAPGTNIVSVKSRHPKASKLWGDFDENYVFAGGTSMATPLTAGAALVTREYLIKARSVANPSGALVKATLMHTAKDLYPGQYGLGLKQELPKVRPNVHEGYGRVDMDQATRLGDETQIVDNRVGVATSEEARITVRAKEGSSLRATLTWTDAPGSPAVAKALINDLDLKVTFPSGETKQLGDHVNNSEMLELTALRAGEYQIVVSGSSVPQGKTGKQPYALLVTTY